VALQQHTTHLTKKYEQLSANYEQHAAHLTEKYEQLSANYEQLRQMVMNMTSQSGDTCAPPFLPYGPKNKQPPPPSAPPLF
jgi:cell division protein FtsB